MKNKQGLNDVIDPEELEYYRLFGKQSELLDGIRSKLPNSAAEFPAPKSSLYGDDLWTAPYHISHVAQMLIGVSLDQLHGLHNLVIVAGVVHPYAPFPLIRSAIENAASALWLLQGTTRKERTTRRYRLLVDGARNRDKLHTALPKMVDNGSLDARLTEYESLVAKRNITPAEIRKKATATAILDEVEASTKSGLSIAAAWQITSGVTHGQQWAILTMLDREVQDDSAAVKNVLVTAGLKPIVWGVACATAALQPAVDLLLQRGTSYMG